jgi:hypothetical protein
VGYRQRSHRLAPGDSDHRPYAYATGVIHRLRQHLWLIGWAYLCGIITVVFLGVLAPSWIPWLLIGWIIGTIMIGVVIAMRWTDIRRWDIGLRAERDAARALNSSITACARRGYRYRIWHDLPVPGIGNIDHLLVAANGSQLIVVETKAWVYLNPERRSMIARQLAAQYAVVRQRYAGTIVAACYLPHADQVYPFDPMRGELTLRGQPLHDWLAEVVRATRPSPSWTDDPDRVVRTIVHAS